MSETENLSGRYFTRGHLSSQTLGFEFVRAFVVSEVVRQNKKLLWSVKLKFLEIKKKKKKVEILEYEVVVGHLRA